MSALTRRRITLIGVSGLSLAAAGVIAPGAFAAGTVNGDVKISNTETVQVLMSADGTIDAKRIYDQLVLTGNGKVDISNPVSEKGLRNLDGFGGLDVRDGKARIKTSVDGTKKFRSVSTFTGTLPLKFDITYTLNGKKIKPADVVGKSGELEVRYVVTNTTGKTQEVPFKDGNGILRKSTEDVVIPMVGSVTTVLPSNFTKVTSAEANAAGDGRGGTQMSFTMTLIPPIGSATAEFGYKAQVKDAVIPTASVSALPVNPLESPSFKGGAASYAAGAKSGQDLTANATVIDAAVLKLRDGAADLVDGIVKLSEGSNALTAGLNSAAPGAKKLADGADQLDDGVKQFESGTGDLSDGVGKLNKGAGALSKGMKAASDGGPQLIDGVAKIRAGAESLDKGLATLKDAVTVGGDTFKSGFATSVNKASADLATGLAPAIDYYLSTLDKLVQDSPNSTTAEKAKFKTEVATVGATLNGTIKGALTGPFASGLIAGMNKGMDDFTSGVAGGVGTPTSTNPDGKGGANPSIRNGLAQLIGGLTLLEDKGGDLVDGLDQLADGAKQLKGGTNELNSGAKKLNEGAGALQDGSSQISSGAGALADGIGKAASGSEQLSDGLSKAAEGAPGLPKGADQLSAEGTTMLIDAGDTTASDYGLKYAMIEAGATRAASAQPNGSPEGATALTAFKFEIAGEDGATSANLKRGMAAIIVIAAAGALAMIRRRGII